jgi:hypothetical protein
MRAISSVVEGMLDQTVATKLILSSGGLLGPSYVKSGKSDIRKKIDGYVNASKFNPYFVLVDLDEDECSPSLRQSWINENPPMLCFRVAEHSIESWMLADRASFSQNFHVPLDEIRENQMIYIIQKGE